MSIRMFSRLPGKRAASNTPSGCLRSRSLMVAIVFIISGIHHSLLAQSAEAFKSEPQSEGLTLPVAVDIALRTNPLVRATSSGREIANAQRGEARAGRLPFIQFNETYTRSNNPVFVFGSLLEQARFRPENFALTFLNSPSSISNLRNSISFRMPVFDQRQAETRMTRAEIGQRLADSQSELVRQKIRFEVVRAYYGLVVANAKKEVAAETVKLAESELARVRDRHEVGMVVASDVLSLEVQLAEFRQQEIQAEGDVVTAQAALNTALGVAIDTPQMPATALVDKEFSITTQEELIRTAIANRPETARSRLERESAQEKVRGLKGEFLPRIDLFGGFGVSGTGLTQGSSDYTVGASLTFNLFDGGRKARLEEARAAESIAAAEEEQSANQIRFEVVRAYQQYKAARARVAVAARAIEQARETLRIIQDRYQEGLTTITEVLRAQTASVRARMSLLGALHDKYVGYAALLLATGKLDGVETFAS